jgi:hypothetical protein
MRFESLKLMYGYPLQLQTNNAAGIPERYSCRLIGCLPGRSILISVPKKAGRLLRFRSGQKIVMRFMIDNGVGVFISQVEIQTADPYPVLHIGYPEKVTFKGIRSSTRVKANLPTQISSYDLPQSIPCIIMDISESGVRLDSTQFLGEIGSVVLLETILDIQGISRAIRLKAVIRSRANAAEDGDDQIAASYGLEFIEQDEDTKLVWLAYVFGQIVHQEISVT